MRWVGFGVGVLGSMLFVTAARAAPLGLPVGTAAFPSEGVVSSAPSTATPAMVAPAAEAPSPAMVAPAAETPSPAMVAPAAAPSVPAMVGPANVTLGECVESPSMFELSAAAISAMMRDGTGVFALLHAFQDGSDTDVIDELASKEERRIVFMRELSQRRDAEGEREFGEKLSLYLRKREFIRGLEAKQQLAPSPFDRTLQQRH